jgi:DNA-binding transcriptional MerR regulator/quercetin dioxygenase-like cupin family protein
MTPPSQTEMPSQNNNHSLKIGDVARMTGISPTVIRMWERLGLACPRRTASRYRLYSQADVRLLKRASFLRKVRGMNAPAIVQTLKREGLLEPPRDGKAGAIGARLRQLRMKKRASLRKVARAAGISVGFLSALERSQMSASVATLQRLARYYETNILDFYDTGEATKHRVRPRDRKALDTGTGVRMELLAWGNTVMEPHLFRVSPGAGSGESYTHLGEEFLYVLKGQLQIFLRDQEYHLKAGDSFYFESTVPHKWTNSGHSETMILWVNTPPTF